VDRVEPWLYKQLEALGDWDAADDPRLEAEAGLDALVACGALDADVAERWRAAFADPDAHRVPVFTAEDPRASEVLEGLLAAETPGAGGRRFGGALMAACAAGAADFHVWDARRRQLHGWPSEAVERAEELELNAGGTNVELREVVAGTAERHGGWRVEVVLLFADGVEVHLEGEDEPDADGWGLWMLSDDLGTSYTPAGSSGGDAQVQVDFRTPVPPEAKRLELRHSEDPALRLAVELNR
jgi:hypothetical protein